MIGKELRVFVWNKYNGRCAYCGKEIDMKQLRIDHINPIWRGHDISKTHIYGHERGTDNIENLNPSCARCNNWKHTWTVEEFRREIKLQVERLEKYQGGFRIAYDFNLLSKNHNDVIFYFEKHAEPARTTTKEQSIIANVSVPVCDCTHTQACIKCAQSKGIDWRIIE